MKVVIIEDETAAVVNLKAILREVAPTIEVLATLEGVQESVAWLTTHGEPDLFFMDIHLADGDSFRIFERIQLSAPVIFTTAYDQYALDAFKVSSIDYLLKPINAADVKRALDKLSRLTAPERNGYGERVRSMAAASHRHVLTQQQAFLVRMRDKIIPLQREDIAFCYTLNEKVTAVDFSGQSYQLDKTLEILQATLPAEAFFRANRQFIVARKAVKEIVVWFGSRLSLRLTVDTPERIVISKTRVPEFKQWLTLSQPVIMVD
ncbi:MAG: LytTR family DNA-binding domain-containing protein [Alistipes sp.]